MLLSGSRTREISGGYRLTTNNRMELIAAIAGLEKLKFPCQVVLYSDSQYLVNAISQGWALKWRAAGWKRNRKDPAKNPDLWQRLLELCETHEVEFRWVRGHAGDRYNERCDELSVQAASRQDLPEDEGYAAGLG